ncbi:DNA methyltransferase [Sulfobacillus thermosulfidooxidans]|uniref:DNA methyltransferase n=1 Tax=Sulfobacillus thermosulfidooxidans TaxID=28034 RepID=UPI00097A1C36|nr:DNA methyltransferase [Sulfobacillus thermosulfidooxidans]OLZ11234.1 DNA methylase [Sulfobacillus thermosulfidooxidans]OLZ13427.1 DNA methylase [Sulfobacillus thermosulfidooxidans]OLZ21674.1 DNA methylase [Sulfobacillus thermosulfidooxidans]
MAWDLEFEQDKKKKGPVTCLGMVFESEEARRTYFTEELKKKLPELKQIEGFPKGRDEDILELSDPPYYTACPNPFLQQIVEEWEQERSQNDQPYLREPYAADVSEGKNDPIYNAHSYHTKVPHKAIMRYILHYTNPGDIVFDGFAGTGMTGVAAQLCGDRKTVESLGYRVEEDGTILSNEDDETVWKPISKLGVRHAILNDLSPAASFIAYNYNTPTDPQLFQEQAEQVLREVEKECGWMYATLPSYATEEQREKALEALRNHPQSILEDTSLPWAKINYTVWSDVFVCPNCSHEIIFWEAAVDKEQGKVQDEFPCPSCGVQLTKKKLERAWVTEYDDAIHETVRHAKQVPVLINYSIGKRREEKIPDAFDWALLNAINSQPIPYWFPTDRMPEGYNTKQPQESHGITHVHQFYTKRNLWTISAFWKKLNAYKWLITSIISRNATKANRYVINKHNPQGRVNGPLTGTLYIPSEQVEQNVLDLLRDRQRRMNFERNSQFSSAVVTAPCQNIGIQLKSEISYVFIDPPFGKNIMYSELNFITESWLRIKTDNRPEAIENETQQKDLDDYQTLMEQSMRFVYDQLKPGHWMTIEFNNSHTAVWNAIMQSVQRAGFIVASVSILDKLHGGIKAMTYSSVTNKDLVVSAYKPSNSMAIYMGKLPHRNEKIWSFVDDHLRHLPVFVGKRGQAQIIEERKPRNIYDQLVAYYISLGRPLPILTSADFQSELVRRYPVRDGMVFMEDQVTEYDQKKQLVKELVQVELFVSNESTAIDWLRQRLLSKPQPYHDLQPDFMKSIQHVNKYERLPELLELLEQNFLKYDGEEEIPNQIISYLRANYHNFRGTEVTREMRQKAKGFWYVPDPRKAADLEKLRERNLWREFEHYRDEAKTSSKRLQMCRTEALKSGFKRLWMEQKYADIVLVGDKLPPAMVQEDIFLSQFINNAKSLMR